MKRKVLVAGVVSSALVLGVSGCLLSQRFDVEANASTRGVVSLTPEEVVAGECPAYFNILCTIKTKNVNYSEVKDKDLVLCYEVNGQFESKEKMEMQVVEYEKDGVTPKVVCFESEVVGREKAWIPYTIFTIDKDQTYDKIFCDTYGAGEEKLQKHVFESDIYECGFASEEKANTFDTVVDLKSSLLNKDDVEDELYTALTYSINGGEEKTVYAHQELNIIPDTAIYDDFTYEAQVFANKGDVIEFKVKVPTKDKDAVYEDVKTVVVK